MSNTAFPQCNSISFVVCAMITLYIYKSNTHKPHPTLAPALVDQSAKYGCIQSKPGKQEPLTGLPVLFLPKDTTDSPQFETD